MDVTDTPARPQPTLPAPDQALIDQACDRACAAIAPAWPLDRSIAVNPHWGRVDRPVLEVAARMAVLGGIRVFPSRRQFRQAWQEARLTEADLQAAIDELGAEAGHLTPADCLDALDTDTLPPQLPLLIDVLDDDPRRHTRLAWRQAITHQVSQTCAAFFDRQQADWHPDRPHDLYTFWRDTLVHDHGIGVLMGLPDLGRRLDSLPATRADAERWVLQRLGLPPAVWADYLESVLLTVNGWASWCAYVGWEARLAGGSDGSLRDLLAIRLAWGAILLDDRDHADTRRAFAALQADWGRATRRLQQAREALRPDLVWQRALEVAYQRTLVQRLAVPGPAPANPEPDVAVQAAFCIDVRSEPLRRALEATWPAIQTLGFAGFFGVPAAYTPLGTGARRPQLPGLLAPAMEVTDRVDGDQDPQAAQARQRRLAMADAWQASTRWPAAAFSFVEVAGAGYLGRLVNWLRPGASERPRDDLHGLPARYRPVCRPALAGVDLDGRIGLARKVLQAMGLVADFAPLVLLVGHGSQSENNAHAAALDCGACCGQTGEVNARVLARVLNEPAVRQGLERDGLSIPAGTAFVPALHNTTTDEIEVFDIDTLPEAARTAWERLKPVLAQAGDQVRRERAVKLGLDPRAGAQALLAQLQRRASDGAQTRPEWGLAGNAAFLIAPRQRSRHAVLDGRSFLHDYDAAKDPDGSVLELLMTAPMLVTHWINWQYHASTCDPQHLGSGNKLLHNVVGGDIGVFEGNGGDLRIGLSLQSLHDGRRWVHDPLRLTVVIDAPAASIDRIVERHAIVRQLLDNGWLHLWRFEGEGFERRVPGGGWRALASDGA